MRNLLAATAVLGLSVAAQASYNGPLMIKSISPGFSPRAYQYALLCKVSRGKVEIQKTVAGISYSYERKIKLELNGLGETLSSAALSKKTTSEGPTDVPGSAYTVVTINPNDTVKETLIKQTGSYILSSEGIEAEQVVNLLDDICKE